MRKSINPKLSVIMPAYNAEDYIEEAIESILAQTFPDFELLIINDGSTDLTEQKILQFNDPRIKYIKNELNIKLVKTLNKGLGLANGEYIARMDSDDISLPNRFQKQIDFLDANKEYGLVGSFFEILNTGEIVQRPIENEEIRVHMLFNSPFAHPSVMMRSRIIKENSLKYDEDFLHCEDYELWTRISKLTKLYNIPEVLIKYRLSEGQITSKYSEENRAQSFKIRQKALNELGLVINNIEAMEFTSVFLDDNYNDIRVLLSWYKLIIQKNKSANYYNPYYLKEYLLKPYLRVLRNNTKFNLSVLWKNIFIKRFWRIGIINNLKFIIKCILNYER